MYLRSTSEIIVVNLLQYQFAVYKQNFTFFLNHQFPDMRIYPTKLQALVFQYPMLMAVRHPELFRLLSRMGGPLSYHGRGSVPVPCLVRCSSSSRRPVSSGSYKGETPFERPIGVNRWAIVVKTRPEVRPGPWLSKNSPSVWEATLSTTANGRYEKTTNSFAFFTLTSRKTASSALHPRFFLAYPAMSKVLLPLPGFGVHSTF